MLELIKRMYRNNDTTKDTILNAKKYLQILEKIEIERNCSEEDHRWLISNSSFMDNNIRNSLLNRYSSKEPQAFLSDERYIKLLTNQNILEYFASRVFGFAGGFNLESIKLIPEAKEFIVNYLEEVGEEYEIKKEKITKSRKIFIVHGKNKEMKESLARTLEKLGLAPIILHEQSSQGKTIIEKFENYSNVGFAIILLSPDDKGYSKDVNPSKAKLRARQNVIFEFGYFVGKIERENVVALYLEDDNFEMPTDLSGYIYIPYDKNEVWKYKLVDELQSSGYNVSKDNI